MPHVLWRGRTARQKQMVQLALFCMKEKQFQERGAPGGGASRRWPAFACNAHAAAPAPALPAHGARAVSYLTCDVCAVRRAQRMLSFAKCDVIMRDVASSFVLSFAMTHILAVTFFCRAVCAPSTCSVLLGGAELHRFHLITLREQNLHASFPFAFVCPLCSKSFFRLAGQPAC
jgi:hypothetical protein